MLDASVVGIPTIRVGFATFPGWREGCSGLCDGMSRYDAIRRAQIEAVGGRFLRARPLVTALGALANGALLSTSRVPEAQRLALGASTGALVLAFALEALALRRRDPGATWLATSLALTTIALGFACALSGGATSPLLPILFAPVAIALAAFGTERGARVVVALAALVLALLVSAALGLVALPFAPLAAPTAERMTLVSAAVSVTLVTLGVARLAEAHRRAGLALEATRAGLLDDALERARLAETTGLRIAHEIRNPLTSIKALVALVARGEIDPKHAKRLDVALGEIARIEALVTDYLSLARPLESISPRPCDARAVAEEVAAVLEGHAREADVRVLVTGPSAPLVADARRLREALLNLGSNAIQALHGAPARTLELVVLPRAGGVRIEVVDSGPGVAPELLPRLGEPLATGRRGGTGLGVLLARGVATQHGGSLRFESTPGRGTRAVLDLPAAPPAEGPYEEESGDGERPDRR